MPLIRAFFLGGYLVALSAGQSAEARLYKGTLVLVSASSTALVFASDSAVDHDGRTTTGHQKIFPIGSKFACVDHGKPPLDPAPIIDHWNKVNVAASVDQATTAMGVLFSKEFKRILKPFSKAETKIIFFDLVCAGYSSDGLATLSETILDADNGFDPYVKHHSRVFNPGEFLPLGSPNACRALIRRSDPRLALFFFNLPTVTRSAAANLRSHPSSLSTSDMLSLSKACLDATEGTIGQSIVKVVVAGPNKYLVVPRIAPMYYANP